MKRKYLFVFIIVLFMMLFIGCGKAESPSDDYNETPSGGNDEQSSINEDEESNIPNRKIIYTVSASIDTLDLSETIKRIRSNINKNEEWCDEERISDDQAYFVIRIRSTRVDAFVEAISINDKMFDYEKTATDISLKYQDTSAQITSLQAERARLVELFENASMSEMIQINSRLTQIDSQILKLQGTLNQFDSLVDYSEITLNIYQVKTIDKLSFGERFVNAFNGGWKALRIFLEYISIVLIAIFPFILLFGLVGIGVYIILKSFKKNKINKK